MHESHEIQATQSGTILRKTVADVCKGCLGTFLGPTRILHVSVIGERGTELQDSDAGLSLPVNPSTYS